MKIKVGDKVVVITGKHKGFEGNVKKIIKKTNRVIIEKVNMVRRYIKPSQSHPDGGVAEFEASIHISNVALSSKKKNKPKKKVIDTKKIDAKKDQSKKVKNKKSEIKKSVSTKKTTKKTSTKK